MESFDYGFSKLGTRKQVFVEGGSAISKVTFNAEPYLARAKALREAQEGSRWGEGKIVGVVPDAVMQWLYDNAENSQERDKASIRWLAANPAYITYPAYFKSMQGRVIA